MYRKVAAGTRLPEIGQFVTTIDSAGTHRVYQRTEHGWNMRDRKGPNSPTDNLPIVYWLEDVEMDSKAITGNMNEHYERLKRYDPDWSSFSEGWRLGRMALELDMSGRATVQARPTHSGVPSVTGKQEMEAAKPQFGDF